MNVAYVLPSISRPSGWRSHALAFIEAMRRHVEPVLVAARSEVESAREAFPGLPVYGLPATHEMRLGSLRGAARLAAAWLAARRLRLPGVDLVHSLEAYPTGLAGCWLAQRLRVPHVLTSHGTYGVIWARTRLDRWLYAWTLRHTVAVCPVSHGTARLMQMHFGRALPTARLRVILNGSDAARRVEAAWAETRPWPATARLLSVGALKPRKGQAECLRAVARLAAEYPGLQYDIAGPQTPGPYLEEIREIIRQGGLQQAVTLHGVQPVEALEALYRQASLFLLAPQEIDLNFEGFGLVFLEAGAYGLPVAAVRSGGVSDAVLDGETGLLVEPDDLDGLAAAIRKLLDDPVLARQMGLAGRRRAEALTWERCAAQYAEVYRRALPA
jgi:glycosyltransferase involved in cell wall biosynthesis